MRNDPVPPVPNQEPPDDDPAGRRSLLTATDNPEVRQDYLVLLAANLPAALPAHLEIRYVPDRRVLGCRGWDAYCDALAPLGGQPLETLAALILGDLTNELIPRWLEVRLSRSGPGRRHAVTFQDRQPQWSDTALPALLRGE